MLFILNSEVRTEMTMLFQEVIIEKGNLLFIPHLDTYKQRKENNPDIEPSLDHIEYLQHKIETFPYCMFCIGTFENEITI